MRDRLSRLIIKGGVLSPLELKLICEASEGLGLKTISFGSRQDILFPKAFKTPTIQKFDIFKLVDSSVEKAENIMSSYISADIFPSTSWLTSDKYLYILEQFRKVYSLKINITDPKQRLVPLFTGHLNFIASHHEDYWYLYVRLPKWEHIEIYPALINSWDMDKIAQTIENLLKEEPYEVAMIFKLVNDAIETNNRTIDKPLDVMFHPFPYYEGMNRISNDKYWLGLYWRNNRYDLDFLKAMCELCAECKIGKISITPWKSFIVKGIPASAKLAWEKFLGKFGINVRHSMLELNWHIPVANDEALQLKNFLVENFNKNDISTYGLTFGIDYNHKKAYYFTSIVIEKNESIESLKGLVISDTYNLLYAQDFDPNSRTYITHAQDIDKETLPELLIELSQLYFEQLGAKKETIKIKEEKEEITEIEVYQCQDCLTVYNPKLGDSSQQIDPNTSFEKLDDNYACPLCDASKEQFKKIIMTQVL